MSAVDPDTVLSQEEVDDLLAGVEDDSTDAPGMADGPDAPAVSLAAITPVDLTQRSRPGNATRDGLAGLDRINARIAREMSIRLSTYARRSANISAQAARIVAYCDATRSMAAPASINVVSIKPLRGHALFMFDAALVSSTVDNLFGGNGRTQVREAGTDFTRTEQRIVAQLLQFMFEEHSAAWSASFSLQHELVRSETQVQFAAIAAADDPVIVSTFDVRFAAGAGSIHLVVPVMTADPLRELLAGKPVAEAAVSGDPQWLGLLSNQLQRADVELVATLGAAELTLAQILALRVGDVVPLSVGETIEAAVDGVAVLEGRYGLASGRYALKVERLLDGAAPPFFVGAPHA